MGVRSEMEPRLTHLNIAHHFSPLSYSKPLGTRVPGGLLFRDLCTAAKQRLLPALIMRHGEGALKAKGTLQTQSAFSYSAIQAAKVSCSHSSNCPNMLLTVQYTVASLCSETT